MKTYRTVGSVFSSILIPIVAVILCAALLVFNAASLITDSAIELVLKDTVSNESVIVAVSDTVMKNIPVNTDGSMLKHETVKDIMNAPSVQETVTEIARSGMDEITSGHFDGTLDIAEKLRTLLIREPAHLNEISVDVAQAILKDPAIRQNFSDAILAGDTTLDDATIDQVMQTAAVTKLFAGIISNGIANIVEMPINASIDVCDAFAEFMNENPALSDLVISAYFPDSTTFYDAVAKAASHADELGVPQPAVGISERNFVFYCLDLYRPECNAYFREVFNAVDFVAADNTAAAEQEAISLVIEFTPENAKTINDVCTALQFFGSVIFLLLIFIVFIAAFTLYALLMLSLKRAVTFSGVTAVLTSILLIVCTFVPVDKLVAANASGATDTANELILSLLGIIWTVLSANITVVAIVCGLIGAVCLSITFMNSRNAEA